MRDHKSIIPPASFQSQLIEYSITFPTSDVFNFISDTIPKFAAPPPDKAQNKSGYELVSTKIVLALELQVGGIVILYPSTTSIVNPKVLLKAPIPQELINPLTPTDSAVPVDKPFFIFP